MSYHKPYNLRKHTYIPRAPTDHWEQARSSTNVNTYLVPLYCTPITDTTTTFTATTASPVLENKTSNTFTGEKDAAYRKVPSSRPCHIIRTRRRQ